MKILVSSDSTCDLSPALLEQYQIRITPLSVQKGGESFRDGVDIDPADIFAHVAAGGELCSTAAVNVADYADFFAGCREYDGVIHVCLGSDFSSCYQNACIAAADFPNVRVIDSKNLSTGHGHIVLAAARGTEKIETPEQLDAFCEELRALTARVEASFVMEKLAYMVKGGRCSSVAALGANLLKLKPCIEVIDGKMQVVKKYRGSYEKCIADYVRERLAGRDDIVEDTLFITHTPVSDSAAETVRAAVRESGKQFAQIYDTDAGCTVSCHCGPGTLGVLFLRKDTK